MEGSEDRAKTQQDAKHVSEIVCQEKEEINEGGSSQSVVEDLLSSFKEASKERAEPQRHHTEEDIEIKV